jgi:hypothetical protein
LNDKVLMRTLLFLSLLINCSCSSFGWGDPSHKKINSHIFLFIPSEMSFLSSWADSLSYHALDADARKTTDPTEAYKHYIDIDNYLEFLSSGTISEDLSANVTLHGQTFIDNNGILPWATLTAYDSLVKCFKRKDWHKAMLFATDLGHYVGDGHNPLHITANYNGQLSVPSQVGLHSRYESHMMTRYLDQINISAATINITVNVRSYIFSYLYQNYRYVDSILKADEYAQIISTSYNDLYYQLLWQKCGYFTKMLLNNGSKNLATLIYTAWCEAGKPTMVTSTLQKNPFYQYLQPNIPNPFKKTTQIAYTLRPGINSVSLDILNNSGQLLVTLVPGKSYAGLNTVEWDASEMNSGIYYCRLNGEGISEVRKMVVMH